MSAEVIKVKLVRVPADVLPEYGEYSIECGVVIVHPSMEHMDYIVEPDGVYVETICNVEIEFEGVANGR